MKWIYVIVGILLFLLINNLIGEYSHRGTMEKVEIIHGGVQP
jgi:hypothetical protein